MNVDDIIKLNDGIYFKYSNVVKNSYKLDPWGGFIVKKYAEDGTYLNEYIGLKDNEIFRQKDVLPYTIKFNPEKLI